jgi:redox-sensitive bicupin YhaK (pirin superfamily)
MRRLSIFGREKKKSSPAAAGGGRRIRTRIDRPRPVLFTGRGTEVNEGEGLKLTRLIGNAGLDMLDPFLLLDWFTAAPGWRKPTGFPDHPHAGIETLTYVLSGAVRHKDNRDTEGVVEAGGVQWISAGSGIVHSELVEGSSQLSGYQLWINQPASEKGKPPSYRAFSADRLPVESRDGADIVVIAGETSGGTRGVLTDTAVDLLFLAVQLEPNASFSEDVAGRENAFIVVHEGEVSSFNERGDAVEVGAGQIAVLGPGTHVQLLAGSEGAEVLIAAASPIREPLARAGGIAMNTRDEVRKALGRYRDGKL